MSTEYMPDDGRTLKKRRQSRLIAFSILLFLLIAAEAAFDIFEIAIGQALLLSNPLRPQTGRVWDEDHKERVGRNELESIADRSEVDLRLTHPVRSMEELEIILSDRSSLSMNREEFKAFYTALPVRQAKQVLDPLNLLELDSNPEWRRAQLSLSGEQLVVYFMNGFDNPLHESHVSLRQEQAMEGTFSDETIDHNKAFSGRTVTADVFLQAFARLDRSMRLQIVNDPYKLVQWGSSLQRVGIAPNISDEGVELIFEIMTDSGTALHTMHASEIAAAYLIAEINTITDTLKLQPPVRKNEDN